ncbi:MAG: TonB-dependent receptor [Saprospiraceae bacterium]|nr:TonB-dependent receptor [Saprospiraceae bacterium]
MKQVYVFLLLLQSIILVGQNQPGAGNWQAQGQSITGKITGRILDNQQTPISYATIVLLDSASNQQITGNITDDDGKFKLENVKTGTYKLHISFLGYIEKEMANLELTLEKPDLDIGEIILDQDHVTLAEVTVTEEAPLIEMKIDKVVYNADKDITNAGGDASDVLRKVPMLSVDLQGNVSLRGSQNIQILINGKPSGMFANGTADALKMIPADQIKNVEVITSPSAKYDGEGSGGIINIVTRKKQVQGYNASVNASVGTRQNNGNVGINAAKGRLGFNANAGFWHGWPADGDFKFIREDYSGNQIVSQYLQDGVTNNSRTGFFGKAGLNYDINAFHNISSSINFRGFGFNSNSEGTASFTSELAQALSELTNRNSDTKTLRSGFDWTTDYRRTFKQPEREFSLAFQMNGDISDLKSDIQSSSNSELLNFLEKQNNDGKNNEYTIQADYVHPFTKSLKMEIGGKSILRRIDSDYQFEQFNQENKQYQIDPSRTNLFNYEQDVYAGYASFNVKLPLGIDLIAGARYEHTSITGDFNANEGAFSNEYSNLLPSVIISKKTNQFSSIKVSYNQRIQRPSLFYINPYRNDNDRRNVSQGNPQLEPENVHQVDLSYNTFVKGLVLSGSIYYKNTQDLIETVVRIDEQGVANSEYQNIGRDNSIGFNLFASKTIQKSWTVRGNFNMYTYNAESTLADYDLSNDGIQFNFFASTSLDLKKGWKAEAFGFYKAPERTLQGEKTSFWMTSVGIQKELWNKRGSIGLNMIDPFSQNKLFRTELRGADFYQTSDFHMPFRSVGVNFRYTFGKLDFKAKPSRSKIKNNDQKAGEDNQQGGGVQSGNN